jgi:sulfur transfer protein SufE
VVAPQVGVFPDSLETYKAFLTNPTVGRKERLKAVLQFAKAQPSLPDEERNFANRVMGCTAQVMHFAKLKEYLAFLHI